jgi:hypothetical protein
MPIVRTRRMPRTMVKTFMIRMVCESLRDVGADDGGDTGGEDDRVGKDDSTAALVVEYDPILVSVVLVAGGCQYRTIV